MANQKLEALRARMAQEGMDAYMVPTSDFHESEYVGEHFKARSYLSGFTGSAGVCVVLKDEAELWTDGRYFIQAENQLRGTGIKLMKIAETVAKENDCLALVTGESIGQVASQTMQSLAVTNEVCELPVMRPLIAFDKQDIVDISLKIGTYETSVLPYEDCCTIFVAKHPVTKPSLKKIKNSEKKLDEKIDELMKTALETREVIRCI